MSEVNNAKCAEWAFKAVQKHSDVTGTESEEMETKLSDLLCSMNHLADEHGLDFEELINIAKTRYEEEVKESH